MTSNAQESTSYVMWNKLMDERKAIDIKCEGLEAKVETQERTIKILESYLKSLESKLISLETTVKTHQKKSDERIANVEKAMDDMKPETLKKVVFENKQKLA